MKIGVCVYSYGGDLQTGKLSLYDALEHAASVGCQGVELVGEQHLPNWPNPSHADLIKLSKYIKSLGMEVCCLSTYIHHMLKSQRDQTLDELKEDVTKKVIMALELGTNLARPYFNGSKEDLIELISACLPILEEYKIIWGIEVHAPYPPGHYMDIIKKFDSPNIRLIPDLSCWQTLGLPSQFQSNDVSTFNEILPYSVHIHGKAHTFNEDGEDPFTPYKAIMQSLVENDFNGYIVGEYEGWVADDSDSREIVRKHVNLMKKYSMSSSV